MNLLLGYYYFSKWKNDGTIELIHELRRDKVRKQAGKQESPSLTCIDSQSVKTTRVGEVLVGLMVVKRSKGVNVILSLIQWAYCLPGFVHSANIYESKGDSDIIMLLPY